MNVPTKPAGEKIVAICQPNFLPWLGYFEMAHRADVYVMLDDAQYTKNHWINRNRIPSQAAEGWMWLTVPVKRGPLATPISAIEINDATPWRTKILRSIQQVYGRAPHYGAYVDDLAALLDRPWRLLAELNVAAIRWLAQALGIADNLVLCSSLGVGSRRDDRVVAICEALGATLYLANNGAMSYIEPAKFHRRGMGFVFQDYRHPAYAVPSRTYRFAPHMSVLDVLFWHGPRALEIVLQGRDPDWRQRVTYGPAVEARA